MTGGSMQDESEPTQPLPSQPLGQNQPPYATGQVGSAPYQYPPPGPQPYVVPAVPPVVRPRRSGAAIAMISVAVVLALVAAAAAGLGVLRKPTAPETCCTDGLTTDVAAKSVSAPGSAAPAAAPSSMCVVGSWKATKETMDASTYWSNGGTRKLTASGSHTFEIHPDGTATETYSNWKAVGSAFGTKITVTLNGTYEVTYKVKGNTLDFSELTAADVTYHWQQSGGGVNNTDHDTDTGLINVAWKISCKGATMTSSQADHRAITWTRTTAYGVYS
jgi:hypothetical protein